MQNSKSNAVYRFNWIIEEATQFSDSGFVITNKWINELEKRQKDITRLSKSCLHETLVRESTTEVSTSYEENQRIICSERNKNEKKQASAKSRLMKCIWNTCQRKTAKVTNMSLAHNTVKQVSKEKVLATLPLSIMSSESWMWYRILRTIPEFCVITFKSVEVVRYVRINWYMWFNSTNYSQLPTLQITIKIQPQKNYI